DIQDRNLQHRPPGRVRRPCKFAGGPCGACASPGRRMAANGIPAALDLAGRRLRRVRSRLDALSIMTKILPAPVFGRQADLQSPANADAPIAADIECGAGGGEADLKAAFDWRQTGGEPRDIAIATDDGATLELSAGGSRRAIDGRPVVAEPPQEYR